MIVQLVLQGKYSPEGKLVSHENARRIVPIALDTEEERGEIQWFYDAETGRNVWGLGNEEDGWWKIMECFECMDPTVELHEGKYPVGYYLTDEEFDEIVRMANGIEREKETKHGENRVNQ